MGAFSDRKQQLFCLPYSGGKAQAFWEIGALLNEDIDVHYVEYSGRGTRTREPYITDYNLFIGDIINQILNARDCKVPYSIFGYSIGVLLAYDIVARKLIPGSLNHMFLGGCCSADIHESTNGKLSSLDDDEFWDKIISIGGVDKQLIKNRKFLKMFSKTLRADFKIGEQYHFEKNLGKPMCDATILYSENDMSYKSVYRWKKLFQGNVDFERFQGDHFFAFENNVRTAAIINERLCKLYE